jgi:hypothetical protein
MGQTRHFDRAPITSGLPLLADNFRAGQHVSKVPNADVFSLAWGTACRHAARYIIKLPKAEHDAEEWQAAMQALILVAEHDGPTIFARIGVMKALNRGHVREFNPSRKEPHWGRRKLARDR